MRNKHLFWIIILLFSLTATGQTESKITFQSIKDNLINFLIFKGDIWENDIKDIKDGKYNINFSGIHNNYKKENLINGIYSFSAPITHTKAYFVIIENNNHFILDISTRDGLDTAISNTLDFCERNKYCSDITEDYISRLIGVYYKINKNPINRFDKNCEDGVKTVTTLP